MALPVSPTKEDGPIDRRMNEAWCPVEQYTGGAEHAVLHLMYARFFAKALNDLGLVHEREPWKRLFNQGQILGADGERMSKSRGNVQDPDELVARYGADTVRLFLMFMGPWDQAVRPGAPRASRASIRFLRRLWTVATDPTGRGAGRSRERRATRGRDGRAAAADDAAPAGPSDAQEGHRRPRRLRWNTMIAALMELTNG